MEETKEQDIVLKTVDDTELKPTAQPKQVAQAVSDISVPNYSLLSLIARGGSGAVFEGRRANDGVKAAVKIFSKELVPDADSRRRFEHELYTLSKLSHPNIVKVLDFGITADSAPFIAMELVDGLSIREELDSEGVFEPKRAALIAREICRALAVAHAESIIHRDLKPKNIVVDNQGIAKVIDFGIAKAIGSSGDTITQYGSIIGTPEYMSPEQCLGQQVDARSDIYSLGCTLFEMLTGIKAFEASTPVQAIAKQISPDRSLIDKKLQSTNAPAALQQIIKKCLQWDCNQRYRHVTELDHDLSAYLLGLQPKFAVRSQAPLQIVLALACAAMLFFFVALPWIVSMGAHAPAEVKAPASAPESSPVPLGTDIQIRDRSGKIIFDDPKATSVRQALQDACARHIRLQSADLRNLNLNEAVLTSLDLKSADLSGASMTRARLTDVDLECATMVKTFMLDSSLQSVMLDSADMRGATLARVSAPNIQLERANLNSAILINANLSGARCKDANFSHANLDLADCRNADLTNVNFDHARLLRTQFSGANLQGANYATAEVQRCGPPSQSQGVHLTSDGKYLMK